MRKGELEFVRRLAMELPSGPAVPFGDDMAEISPGRGWLWTTDMLMDGVDFDSKVHPWRAIGRKAMAVNLSDCAAMAAQPVAALCAVALHDGLSMDDALELMRGVRDCGAEFGCSVTGGDTNSWASPTVIAVTVCATMPNGLEPVRRDGARPADAIYLSGPVGGSMLGRHMTFTPRIALAQRIAGALGPRAMIDVSDGLSLDLWRIATASGCGAVLDEIRLSHAIHPDASALAAQTGRPALEHALSDGEDFELIVALPPNAPRVVIEAMGLTHIGDFVADTHIQVRRADGAIVPLEVRGWEHFQ